MQPPNSFYEPDAVDTGVVGRIGTRSQYRRSGKEPDELFNQPYSEPRGRPTGSAEKAVAKRRESPLAVDDRTPVTSGDADIDPDFHSDVERRASSSEGLKPKAKPKLKPKPKPKPRKRRAPLTFARNKKRVRRRAQDNNQQPLPSERPNHSPLEDHPQSPEPDESARLGDVQPLERPHLSLPEDYPQSPEPDQTARLDDVQPLTRPYFSPSEDYPQSPEPDESTRVGDVQPLERPHLSLPEDRPPSPESDQTAGSEDVQPPESERHDMSDSVYGEVMLNSLANEPGPESVHSNDFSHVPLAEPPVPMGALDRMMWRMDNLPDLTRSYQHVVQANLQRLDYASLLDDLPAVAGPSGTQSA